MKTHVLARRYAKALFELALEKGILKTVANEVQAFEKLISESDELRHFLLSPEVGREGKVKFLTERMQDQFSALFVNFWIVLLRKGRQDLYPEIVQEFGKQYDRYQNRVRASAITAVPMQEKELSRLKKTLSDHYKANFEIENFIDPEVLGGLILKIDGKVIDASLRNQLAKLREILLVERN